MAQKKEKDNTTEKRTRGKPRVKIDYETVTKLAAMFCTDEEIASFLGISSKTIQRRKQDDEEYCLAYKKGFDMGRVSLRQSQYKSAVTQGNVTMQIWLGKQYLGQKDQVKVDDTDMCKIDELIDSLSEVAKKR